MSIPLEEYVSLKARVQALEAQLATAGMEHTWRRWQDETFREQPFPNGVVPEPFFLTPGPPDRQVRAEDAEDSATG